MRASASKGEQRHEHVNASGLHEVARVLAEECVDLIRGNDMTEFVTELAVCTVDQSLIHDPSRRSNGRLRRPDRVRH